MEQVVSAGIAHASNPELAWEAMASAAVGAELSVRRRIGYLSTIASVSTMIGLVGTVYGLILAFGAVGSVSAADRAARLSEGSATAMATTAFGLVVAIPSLVAWSVADASARELLGRIEQTAGRLVVELKARA
jgi:biopolymer transport protein ExbB